MINNNLKTLSNRKSSRIKLSWETNSTTYKFYLGRALVICRTNYIGYLIDSKYYLFNVNTYFNI